MLIPLLLWGGRKPTHLTSVLDIRESRQRSTMRQKIRMLVRLFSTHCLLYSSSTVVKMLAWLSQQHDPGPGKAQYSRLPCTILFR